MLKYDKVLLFILPIDKVGVNREMLSMIAEANECEWNGHCGTASGLLLNYEIISSTDLGHPLMRVTDVLNTYAETNKYIDESQSFIVIFRNQKDFKWREYVNSLRR